MLLSDLHRIILLTEFAYQLTQTHLFLVHFSYKTEVSERISGSFTGRYMQVLPADGRLQIDPNQLWMNAELLLELPQLIFKLRITNDGLHTLFLRWAGGDLFGGGDSVFVAMYDEKGKLMTGVSTLKPVALPIQDTQFVGCCYNMYFHNCACLPPPPHPGCTNWTHGGLNLFVNKSYAASLGVTCEAPNHQLERLHNPRWYAFAGKEGGQDFDAWGHSWDASCEAEGMGTKDSGSDFAQWQLKTGEYHLKIFPRETGVAIDAIYVEGPKSWPASTLTPTLFDHQKHKIS